MKTGPAQINKFVFVYEIKLDSGKKFYYDIALPFWNLVDARTYANWNTFGPYKVLEVFPL